MTSFELMEMTISDLLEGMAQGKFTARQLTQQYLDRIAYWDNKTINAVIELNPDALTIAQERDTVAQMDIELGPLHGIPVLLKGNIGTGDVMRTTAGAAALADHRCDRDAFIVTQLREAGAVILGKANLVGCCT